VLFYREKATTASKDNLKATY